MTEGLWTIEELSERVADALAVGYPGQPSGRVREVPDRRTIRWYTTTGLVDRPAEMRGRTALYGRRHLLQLVAIKRLQTQGLTLADVQQQLLGAADDDLERIASIPGAAHAPAPVPLSAPPPPAHRHSSPPRGVAMRTSHSSAGPLMPDAAERTRFWAAPPAAETPVPPAAPPAVLTSPALVHGVRLGTGVTLLLDGRQPDAADLTAIVDAAAPLLELLGRLNLAGPSATNRSAPKGTP
jgi:DNA-binding transcriptional MerR regulator